MKVIKDKNLLKKVLNVIYNVDFGIFHRNLKVEKTKENIKEHEELLKLYKEIDTNIESHKFFIKQIEDFIEGQKQVLLESEKLDKIELPFIEELQTKYEKLNDGLYKFDEDYFKERLNVLETSRFTENLSTEVLMLMNELEYPLYDEVRKYVEK